MKKLTRDRVVPIISARVSCVICVQDELARKSAALKIGLLSSAVCLGPPLRR